MASVRAKYSVLTMLSVVDLTFHRWIMGVKLGAATAVSTASTAITVSRLDQCEAVGLPSQAERPI